MAESGADEGIMIDPESVAKVGWEQHKGGERIIWPSKTAAAQFPRLLPHKTVPSLGEDGFEDGTLPFLAR